MACLRRRQESANDRQRNRSRRRLEDVPNLPQSEHHAETGSPPTPTRRVRGVLGPPRRVVRYSHWLVVRPHRRQRSWQEHDAQGARPHPRAGQGPFARTDECPRCSNSVQDSTPNSPAARTSSSTATSSVCRRTFIESQVRRDRRVLWTGAVHRPTGEDVLVWNVRPSRLLRGRRRRTRHPARRRGARSRATSSSSGDARRRMSEIRSSGRTVVFVSHGLSQVQQLCDHAVWLDKGEVQIVGRDQRGHPAVPRERHDGLPPRRPRPPAHGYRRDPTRGRTATGRPGRALRHRLRAHGAYALVTPNADSTTSPSALPCEPPTVTNSVERRTLEELPGLTLGPGTGWIDYAVPRLPFAPWFVPRRRRDHGARTGHVFDLSPNIAEFDVAPRAGSSIETGCVSLGRHMAAHLEHCDDDSNVSTRSAAREISTYTRAARQPRSARTAQPIPANLPRLGLVVHAADHDDRRLLDRPRSLPQGATTTGHPERHRHLRLLPAGRSRSRGRCSPAGSVLRSDRSPTPVGSSPGCGSHGELLPDVGDLGARVHRHRSNSPCSHSPSPSSSRSCSSSTCRSRCSSLLLQSIFTIGVSFWLAAANVRYKDVEYLTSVFLLAYFYLTPILYSPSFIPEHGDSRYRRSPGRKWRSPTRWRDS